MRRDKEKASKSCDFIVGILEERVKIGVYMLCYALINFVNLYLGTEISSQFQFLVL